MDFIMASFFVAFFYGMLYPAIEFLEDRFNLRLIRALSTALIAVIPTYTLGIPDDHRIIFAFSVAFAGLALVTIIHRVVMSAPTIIRAVGQD